MFEVGTCDGRVLILKVGETPLGVEEIRKNCAGYAAIRELGLGRLIPEISSWSVGEREAFILMEHCGNDFVTESRRLSDPEAMYRQLVDLLRDVYQYSIAMRRRGGGRTVLVAKQRIATLYSQQLGPVLDRQGHHAPLIERVQKVAIEAGPLSCFASWEFAPRNVFLSDGRLKFADPNWVVTGLPIIELAMFAGMARDNMHLPGSDLGYQVIEDFAVCELSELLRIEHRDAQKTFWIGRALQCLLGARNRLSKFGNAHPQVPTLFGLGITYLEKVVAG